MQEMVWFRAFVEQILSRGWERDVTADGDGDYLYRYGTAACFVRLEAGPPAGVRVVARAAGEVKRSAKLLTEINELNAHARSVSTYWWGGSVWVDKSLDASSVNEETLMRACGEVGTAADEIGALIAGMFDGTTPFQPATR